MGDSDEFRVLDLFGMTFQLPGDVEGDMDGRGSDGKGRGNVALQRVAYHQQFVGLDTQMFAELLELRLALVAGNLDMGEMFGETAAVEFVLLVLQLTFGEDDEAIGPGLQTLQGRLNFGQWGGWQMEQKLAMAEQLRQLGGREMVASHAQGRLDDGDGESLATIAEVGHIPRLRLVELLCRHIAIGRNERVEVVLYGFKVRLTVPEGVVGIEGYDSEIFWQWGHVPLIIRLDDVASKPSGRATWGTSA